MDAVAEQIFQDKRMGKDPRWNMNYIVNEWVKMNNLRRTLLFQATFHNNIDIVQALLDHGVCVSIYKTENKKYKNKNTKQNTNTKQHRQM